MTNRKILFCTNNKNTNSLYKWLKRREYSVVKFSDPIELKHCHCYNYLISYNYRHKIPLSVINFFKGRCINLHISYLPFNRGADPNIWSFLEGTPSGVSIHEIDKGWDTGNIIIQKRLTHTGRTLAKSYTKLHAELQKLFKANWERLRIGWYVTIPNIKEEGTYHNSDMLKDFKASIGSKLYKMPIEEVKRLYYEQHLYVGDYARIWEGL